MSRSHGIFGHDLDMHRVSVLMTSLRRLRALCGAIFLIGAVVSCGASTPAESTAEAPRTATDAATSAVSAETAVTSEAEGEAGEGAPNDDPTSDQGFIPSDSDVPFSTQGGAASADDGVEVVSDLPTVTLSPLVREITAAWPTDWTRRTADLSTLAAGLQYNDPRDGIPPIDQPRFETLASASAWLADSEPGAVVVIDDDARFYPLSIMTRHEIVNDRFDDVPVAVTFCPLCNSAVAFDRRVDGQVLRFGVSGLLRNSDLVMWDDASTSLWQQLTGEGIVGQFAGTSLTPVSSRILSFSQFAAAYPDGWSLGADQGFGSTYGSNPYVGYSSRSEPIGAFFTGDLDDRLPALERVVGIRTGSENKAFAFSALSAVGAVNDRVGDVDVVILWAPGTTDALDGGSIAASRDVGTGVAYSRSVNGTTLTFEQTPTGFRDVETETTWSIAGKALSGPLEGAVLAPVDQRNDFWFAWAAFYPETRLFS